MNRREFVKTGLCAAVAASYPELFAQALAGHAENLKGVAKALSPLEQELMKDTLAKFDAVNPIDAKTGRRKFISFGFITDLHKCKRIEGDDARKNTKKDYWYDSAGVLTVDDPSIRLLGAVAKEADLDAVINGGDMSTAPTAVPLGEKAYIDEIANVKALFDAYLPKSVPLFTVDGNHERRYKSLMNMSDETWRAVQRSFNTSAADAKKAKDIDVTYHRDLPHPTLGRDEQGTYAGNTFNLDFRRLYKEKGYNVRLVCLSEYDRCPGASVNLRGYDATNFYDPATQKPVDPERTAENTIVGFTGHNACRDTEMLGGGYLSAGSRRGGSTCNVPFKWNLGTHKGMGCFGMVAGHAHQTIVKPYKGFDAACVQVTRCYTTYRTRNGKGEESETKGAYRFSLFVLDTDSNKMKEIRLAGEGPVVSETGIARADTPRCL